jgi:cyclic pyranopterin phosphate synthase
VEKSVVKQTRKRRDPFRRVIEYPRLSATDRCDLRRRYCMLRGFHDLREPQGWFIFGESERVAAAFARLGVRRVQLTGG